MVLHDEEKDSHKQITEYKNRAPDGQIQTQCNREKSQIELEKKYQKSKQKTTHSDECDGIEPREMFFREMFEHITHNASGCHLRFAVVLFYRCFHRGSSKGCKNAFARARRVLMVFSFISMTSAISRIFRSS